MRHLFICSLMALSLFGCGIRRGGHSQPAPEGPLNYYEYQKSNGRMMYPLKYIRVDRTEEGGVKLEWSEGSDDITVVQLAPDALEHIDALFKEYGLKKLKTLYLPWGDVRDGIMWHAYFGYAVHSVSTGGDQAWPPERLNNGILAINDWLDAQVKDAPESAVIGHRSHQDRD